jgi:hypothetical protein
MAQVAKDVQNAALEMSNKVRSYIYYVLSADRCIRII